MQKNKYLMLGLIIVTVAVFSINKINNNLFSNNTMLVSTPVFTVDPKEQNLDIGQSATFTIINNSTKTIIPNWTFSSGYDKYIDTTACQSPSLTCTIKSIKGPANLQIIASYNNGLQASQAKLNISSTTYKSNDSKSTNTFYIEPSKAYLDIGESFVFESYSETSTGIVSIKTNWSVADSGVLDNSDCKSYSNQCKIKTLSGPVETKVTAELNGKKVEATVSISSDEFHASAEDEPVTFYIEPKKLLIKKGDKHTFTSYTETATAAVATKSTWKLDTSDLATDDPKVASIENCDKKSSCTFYAGMNAGTVELHSSANDNEAMAYIEIAN